MSGLYIDSDDWGIVKDNLKKKWSRLTDGDLQYEPGKEEELVSRIRNATGESREDVLKAVKMAGVTGDMC